MGPWPATSQGTQQALSREGLGSPLELIHRDTGSPASGLVGGRVVSNGASQLWLQRRSGLTLGHSSSLLGTQSAWLGSVGSEAGQERAVRCPQGFGLHVSTPILSAK